MDILKERLVALVAAIALGSTVVMAASPSSAQAPDHQVGMSRAATNYECCIVDEQYAERSGCNMEIYRSKNCMTNQSRDN